MRLLGSTLAVLIVACGSSSSSPSPESASSSSGSSSSGSSSVETVTTGRGPAALDGYCTVQSTVPLEFLESAGSQAWFGNHSKAAAGSTVYLAWNTDFGGEGEWNGYVFVDGTTPAQLASGPVDNKLVEGTHFTGSCAIPTGARSTVQLKDAQLFATIDLSGTACTIPAGTELPNYPDYGYSTEGNGIGGLSSSVVQTKCGYAKGFTKDLATAPLVKK